jgi:hypothetical protein
VVAAPIVGFCEVEVKVFGPFQKYVAPVMVLAVRLNVDPTQTVLLLPAVGAEGVWVIETEVVATGLIHPEAVAETE